MGKFLTIFHALADTTKNETRRYRACTGVIPTPLVLNVLVRIIKGGSKVDTPTRMFRREIL